MLCVSMENRARGMFWMHGCLHWEKRMAREFKNADQLVRELSKLTDKLQQKAVKSAARKGANVIKKAAQLNAKRFDDPATAARVWKEIVVRYGNKRYGEKVGGVVLRIGVKGGAKRYVDNKENRRKQRVGGS